VAQVRLRTGTLPGNDLRQVVHTHVPLSPSSIIWNRFHRWDVNRHTARYTGPVSVVSQCKNWCLAEETEITAALWAVRLGKDFTFTFYVLRFTQPITFHELMILLCYTVDRNQFRLLSYKFLFVICLFNYMFS